MSTAIADAVAGVFADPNLAVDGTFLPAAGGSVPVRVVWSRPDEAEQLFQANVLTTRRIAEIRAAEIALPKEGDSLQIPVGGGIYKIIAAPRQPDPDRHVWRLELGAPS